MDFVEFTLFDFTLFDFTPECNTVFNLMYMLKSLTYTAKTSLSRYSTMDKLTEFSENCKYLKIEDATRLPRSPTPEK